MNDQQKDSFLELTLLAQRKKISSRPHSFKNASTSRARTAHHSFKYSEWRGNLKALQSKQMWSLDVIDERRTLKFDQ